MRANFLDETAPLDGASHSQVTRYFVRAGSLAAELESGKTAGLKDAGQFAGHTGEAAAPRSVLLVNHGLHVELMFDRSTRRSAKDDKAGVSDVILEAALTTIMDFEDSVATVDAEDKVLAYRNWLGLMKGDLTARFQKGTAERRPRAQSGPRPTPRPTAAR